MRDKLKQFFFSRKQREQILLVSFYKIMAICLCHISLKLPTSKKSKYYNIQIWVSQKLHITITKRKVLHPFEDIIPKCALLSLNWLMSSHTWQVSRGHFPKIVVLLFWGTFKPREIFTSLSLSCGFVDFQTFRELQGDLNLDIYIPSISNAHVKIVNYKC